MENPRIPFVPEEAIRTQRVEVYLTDLKERIKTLRLQHDTVINTSVEIIKEIDKVSNSLSPQNGIVSHSSNIKQLIQEFETIKSPSAHKMPVHIESKVNIRQILENFEKLNQSHVLKDSLVLFIRAKESFDKIDSILQKDINNNNSSKRNESVSASSNLREKIKMFNQHSSLKETRPIYASCCSSVISLESYKSTQDFGSLNKQVPSTTNSLGYEGDNDDSEYDLHLTHYKNLS